MILTMPKCPMSEMAVENAKKLAETYDILIDAALKMEKTENVSEFLQKMAWQRVERAARALDNLLIGWEEQCCDCLRFDCRWQHTRRNLEIISALTPCDQWRTDLSPLFSNNSNNNHNRSDNNCDTDCDTKISDEELSNEEISDEDESCKQ